MSQIHEQENESDGITLVGLTHPFRGGIAHYTTMLYQALQKDYQPNLISFTRQYPRMFFPGLTQFDQSRRVLTAEHHRIIDAVNPLSWVKAFRTIKAQRPGLVVFQWWHPFFGPCLGTIAGLLRWLARQRIVFICHNIHPHERHGVDRLLTWYGLANAHKLIVHSEAERVEAHRMFPCTEIVSAPHPAYDQFCFQGLSQKEAQTSLGVEGRVLLCFGYVRAYKGLEHLLKALPEVLRELEVTLLVAGEFYEPGTKYDDLIHELGLARHVRVIDRYIPNEEVEVYFSACDVVVCPYTSGTQSGIIQIAYSFQKPVICTNVGGLPEVVVEGKTGFIVPPRNPQALAGAILAYYRLQDKAIFSTEITKLQERFTWERLVATIIE